MIHPLILKDPGLNAFVNLLSLFEYKKLITPNPTRIIIPNIPTGESIVFFLKIIKSKTLTISYLKAPSQCH